MLSDQGYTAWPHDFSVTLFSPGGRSYPPSPSGFAYVQLSRAFSDSGPGTLRELTRFQYSVRVSSRISHSLVSIMNISLSCRHLSIVLSVLPTVVMPSSESSKFTMKAKIISISFEKLLGPLMPYSAQTIRFLCGASSNWVILSLVCFLW